MTPKYCIRVRGIVDKAWSDYLATWQLGSMKMKMPARPPA